MIIVQSINLPIVHRRVVLSLGQYGCTDHLLLTNHIWHQVHKKNCFFFFTVAWIDYKTEDFWLSTTQLDYQMFTYFLTFHQLWLVAYNISHYGVKLYFFNCHIPPQYSCLLMCQLMWYVCTTLHGRFKGAMSATYCMYCSMLCRPQPVQYTDRSAI